MAFESTNRGEDSFETLQGHPLMPRTPGERVNKLLAGAQRAAKAPLRKGQVDCSWKAEKISETQK